MPELPEQIFEQGMYPWQQSLWMTLTTRFPDIGHGLLFYGKSGCGKHDFAQQFLAWVLCLNKQPMHACGHCASCVWLKSDTHPNFVAITTDEDNKKQNAKIKIEQIRDLLPFVQQTVEGWRVILITPAEALNIASSNALLKTLEEPGERTLIILLAEHYLKLPATIRSRLQHYALDRMLVEQTHEFLAQHLPNLDHQRKTLLLNLADQMPLKALALHEQGWVNERAEFVQDWLNLVKHKHMPMQFATKWQKKLNFNEFITMFEYLLNDVISMKSEQQYLNIDLDFSQLQSHYSLEKLFQLYDDMNQYKQMSAQNVQANLLIDQLTMQLMNV